MKLFRYLLALYCTSIGFEAISAAQPSLERILTRMDQQGEKLRSLSSSITQKRWTDILEEFDEGESGRFHFLKEGGKLYLRKDIEEPQENVLVIREGTVFFYQPRIKQVQRYDLGQKQDRAEFLLLGFGSDKEALKEAYRIELVGEEALEGKKTYQLELTPRSDKVSAYFSKIVLWIDPDLWIPVQQKLVEPTQDYLLIQFQDIEINPRLSKSRFELKLPRDVQVVGQ